MSPLCILSQNAPTRRHISRRVKMRIQAFILLSLILTVVSGQEKDKWKRVYTYDDSFVEVNESKVIIVDNKIVRVLFRTTYSKQQSLRGKPNVKYKTMFESIEFKCEQRLYRQHQLVYRDSKGIEVETYESKQDEEWRSTTSSGSMRRFMSFGCQLGDDQRRKR